MIIGVGTDLLDIRRVAAVLERFGDRFAKRLFTDIERARARRRPDPAAVYAQCYAAKEACSKALGTGMRQGVFWRDMGVENLPSGKPYLVLQFDGHANDAGMLTRCEAYLDSKGFFQGDSRDTVDSVLELV